ncbi:MAG: leucine-rich repeat domain-containing protein, partial [Huintestinicola sp.]
MKKIISLAIALCLMLTVCSTGLMSLTAAAAQTIEGSEVTWSFDNITKTLTFGGTGDIPDYDTYKDEGGNATMPWAGIDYTSVVFGDGITGIGSYVFYKNYTMESLTVPATITKIGKGAFFECNGLRSITVEGGITKVEEQTFSTCSSLETVNLPETVTEIGAKAFYKCSALKTVELPDSVNTIGDSAFHSCILLKTFEAPDSLEKIADRAFFCCESLETLTLNDNIAEIGESAFDGCEKLTAVSFPSSVRTISSAAFSGCSKLATVEFADGITTIGEQAFYLCTSLKSVNIPHTVETIGKKAFGYGKSGSKIDGFAITGYDENAAQSYATENEFTFNSLGKYFPKNGAISETLTWEVSDDGVLTFTGTGAIGDSTADAIPEYMLGNPKSIVLCEGITAVGAYAFLSDCKEIAVPKSVTAIGEKAFGYTVDGDGNVVKVGDFTITGYEGSDAERYATENELILNKIQLDLGFKLGEEAKICTFDEENKIITVYDKEATVEKILADFVVGDDLTV